MLIDESQPVFVQRKMLEFREVSMPFPLLGISVLQDFSYKETKIVGDEGTTACEQKNSQLNPEGRIAVDVFRERACLWETSMLFKPIYNFG